MSGDLPRMQDSWRAPCNALLLLVVGLLPLPTTWHRLRSTRDVARLAETDDAGARHDAGGYYEGLIGVDGPEASASVLARRLRGKGRPAVRFTDANVSRMLRNDLLMFELLPDVKATFFGQPFTTNAHGMRDGPHALAKPPGTFRIAVLGSSIDMGWGVGTEATYANLLEGWLNAHAARRKIARRFEVLNFAVAAYSPVQRLASFHRKARRFQPDLVLYSATMLDLRLLEIHLCDMLERRVDLEYDYLRQAVAAAGLSAADLALDAHGRLRDKDRLKRRLEAHYAAIYDATLSVLARDCRAAGIPLACVIVPRAGKADAPAARAETVASLRDLLGRHAGSVFDLSATFDKFEPSELEIAPWDDHPNTRGHRRLFLALARGLVHDRLYTTLFPAAAEAVASETGTRRDNHDPYNERIGERAAQGARDNKGAIGPVHAPPARRSETRRGERLGFALDTVLSLRNPCAPRGG
jgi:hypothetical protein